MSQDDVQVTFITVEEALGKTKVRGRAAKIQRELEERVGYDESDVDNGRCSYMPTLDQIAAMSAEINAEWTPEIELSRRTGNNNRQVPYEIPRYKKAPKL